MKNSKRQKIMAEKKARKLASYKEERKEKRDSKYGRKRKYLDKAGLFGFQVPEPKPWR